MTIVRHGLFAAPASLLVLWVLVTNSVQPAFAYGHEQFLAAGVTPTAMLHAKSGASGRAPAVEDLHTGGSEKWKFDPEAQENWVRQDRRRRREVTYRQMVIEGIITWAIWVVLSILVYNLAYPRPIPEADSSSTDDAKFLLEHGHFDCLSDVDTCLNAFLCMALRWAHTQQAFGLTSCGLDVKRGSKAFWSYFSLFVLCALFNGVVHGTLLFGLFTTLLMVAGRQQIRARFKMQHNTCWTTFVDCAFACCCPCCLIAQEARAANAAYRTGDLTLGDD